LQVCGSVCDEIVGTYPNVQWLGRVADLGSEYGSAQVCLVPLPLGSGLKIKLVEAFAYGRATVSTSPGLQGLRQFAGRAVVVADTPADFAGSVVMLLNDPERRRQLEQEARSLAETWLSPERCYQPFVDRIIQESHNGRVVALEVTR
jgi:glycosyltransferase involved in cell wall biosynthesis